MQSESSRARAHPLRRVGEQPEPGIVPGSGPVKVPAAKLSRVDMVTDELMELIRTSRQPGDRLPTVDQLGEQFGASRSVVREAIARVAAQGLVEVRQGDGTFVREPDIALVAKSLTHLVHFSNRDQRSLLLDAMETRRVLEGEAARLAASRATPADLSRISHAYEQGRRAHDREDRAAINEWDSAFHGAIADASHNSVLQLMTACVRPLMDEVRSMYPPRRLASAIKDHELIMVALLSRAPLEAAERAMEHIDHVNTELSHLLFDIES
ncbi:FCD domain-containing protein [Nakamurella sp. YIM 132087]|uniref:FCD domain-containing protein n=1 Tax=Nakamurella alba TaxID=2665158 RepID=A0A7K1FVD0_9ACTN|nr:FadR/GntR family transcriptional regulator [Nakamurella alba]MTD17163.1 FCD domain-containing protein [Nakamurella alba]